ncbi:MAG: TadE family protein [Allopontixanthobacter sp.]|nr:TadE family protein [Allopontixanthobacter sp.]
MGNFPSHFLSDTRGSAAEFALLLPLSMLFFLGIIDAGRYAYTFNQGEKATQIGARWSVVTDPVATELANETYVGTTIGGVTLTQGDRIPAGALGLITCDDTTCTCTTSPCPTTLTSGAAPFAALLGRMQQIMPEIEASNLIIEYRGSGLGFAGDPNGMDVVPLVTIRLVDMDFSPIFLFGGTVGLPDFSYTLTMEDGAGTGSN